MHVSKRSRSSWEIVPPIGGDELLKNQIEIRICLDVMERSETEVVEGTSFSSIFHFDEFALVA